MNLEEKSYVFGLLGTDGSLYLTDRNRGKITLEINIKDRDICEKLFSLIPNSKLSERTRDTNFKEGYHSICFTNHQLSFRQELIDFGFPTEGKTNNISIPTQEYSERDFWRGVIDGDGSIGYTANGFPFVSLVTKSEFLKQAYCKMLLHNFGIEKNISRNKRDNVYNITVYKEDAQKLCDYLYTNSTLYINRKYKHAMGVLRWVRPASMKKAPVRKAWDKEQDEYILTHSLEESMKHLNRTRSSVETRLYRLNKK
jgi:hypothetical protein